SMTPFRQKTKRPTQGRNLNLYIALTASAGETSKTVAEFTEQATKEIYKYVGQGRMVNVFYLFPTKCTIASGKLKGAAMNVSIKIKDARQPIDFKKLACIAYPAFFRHFAFMGSQATQY